MTKKEGCKLIVIIAVVVIFLVISHESIIRDIKKQFWQNVRNADEYSDFTF